MKYTILKQLNNITCKFRKYMNDHFCIWTFVEMWICLISNTEKAHNLNSKFSKYFIHHKIIVN